MKLEGDENGFEKCYSMYRAECWLDSMGRIMVTMDEVCATGVEDGQGDALHSPFPQRMPPSMAAAARDSTSVLSHLPVPVGFTDFYSRGMEPLELEDRFTLLPIILNF